MSAAEGVPPSRMRSTAPAASAGEVRACDDSIHTDAGRIVAEPRPLLRNAPAASYQSIQARASDQPATENSHAAAVYDRPGTTGYVVVCAPTGFTAPGGVICSEPYPDRRIVVDRARVAPP